ncbi:hypothetical protein Tco_0520021 [Tanacetum coccineum]
MSRNYHLYGMLVDVERMFRRFKCIGADIKQGTNDSRFENSFGTVSNLNVVVTVVVVVVVIVVVVIGRLDSTVLGRMANPLAIIAPRQYCISHHYLQCCHGMDEPASVVDVGPGCLAAAAAELSLTSHPGLGVVHYYGCRGACRQLWAQPPRKVHQMEYSRSCLRSVQTYRLTRSEESAEHDTDVDQQK